MELYPSIDLRGGKVVRLLKGDYAQETVYGDDPAAVAAAFVEAGARWVHVVDLDAARSGESSNRGAITRIVEAVAGRARLQCGGGVRSVERARELGDIGVERVVIGTAAIEQPELVAEIARLQPVAVGLDVRGREVAVHGWTKGTGVELRDALGRFADSGAEVIVITQIAVDGTLQGPDLALLGEALAAMTLVREQSFVWTAVTQEQLVRHGVTMEEVEGLIDIVRRTAEADVA